VGLSCTEAAVDLETGRWSSFDSLERLL